MIVSGNIERVCNPVTGNKQDGTQWVRQDFVIVLDGGGNYPDRVLVTAFGERVGDVQRLTTGQHVTAHIDLKVTDYNGRLFNNVNLFRFEDAQQATQQPQPQQPQPQPQPQPARVNINPQPSPFAGSDQLPF